MAQLGKLMVSSSPHIAGKPTVKGIMGDVLIALAPASLVGIAMFGFYSLLVILVSVAACVLSEIIFDKIAKKKNTTGDLSAIVTGLLLGLNLPPLVPLYVPVIGGVFAIMIVKMLFGGLGKNFANPAIAARIFVMLSFAEAMSRYISPLDYSGGFFNVFFRYFGQADSVASATPLQGGAATLTQLFLGYRGGCIGETSALALLAGGIYLTVRKVIDLRLPFTLILTVAVFTFVFSGDISGVLPAVLSGGIMLGSVFMATDYATSPDTVKGMLIYAFVIGFFTVIIRHFSSMAEGMSFSVLIGNLITPLLDKYILPKNFGRIGGAANGK